MDFVWFILAAVAVLVCWHYIAPVYDRVVAWLKAWVPK